MPKKENDNENEEVNNSNIPSTNNQNYQIEEFKLKKVKFSDTNIHQSQAGEKEVNEQTDSNFCLTCYITYSIRGRHCNICDICIAGYDHHCFFLGVCIGEKNKMKYILFLTATLVEIIYTSTMVSYLDNI